jgi:hypothetical protein
VTVPPPRPARREHAAAAAVLALAWALFFLPALASSDQFLLRDAGRLHHPMKEWVAQRLRQGTLPQWNPYSGLGVPLLGGAVDAVLHPFNLLLAASSFEAAFKGWVLLSYLAAALGAYAWSRQLGCRLEAALVAALAFALSGHLVSSSDNLTYLTTLAFLPWVFAAGHAFAHRPNPGRLLAVGIASAVCAAGGDPQAWGMAMAGLAAHVAWSSPAGAGGRLRGPALALGAALAAAAPVVLPVALWLPESSRTAAFDPARTAYWDLLPRRALELVIPNLLRTPPGTMVSEPFDVFSGGSAAGLPWVSSLYFGVSTLLLALFGAAGDRRARALLGAALLGFWMACGDHLGFSRLAAHLPVLGRFRYWEKMFIWPTLLAGAAAGLGLARLLASGPGPRRKLVAAAGTVGLLLLLAGVGGGLAPEALARAVAGTPARAPGAAALVANALDGATLAGAVALLLAAATALLDRPRLARLAPLLLVAVVGVDLFAANGHAYVLSPSRGLAAPAPLLDGLARTDGPRRILTPFQLTGARWPELTPLEGAWTWGARALYAPWNVPRRVGNFDPYGALAPARLEALRNAASPALLARHAGVWGVSHLLVPSEPALAARLELPPPYTVDAADPELPAFLVRLPHRPRAYVAAALAEAGERSRDATLALDPAGTATVLEAPVPAGYAAQGEARIARDEPEQVVVEVTASRDALLVLSDQHAPGWTARVDGRPAPILRANHLVRGVWVPAGRHEVAFRYRTPGLREGAAVAAAFLAALAAWALARRWRAHRGPAAPT